MRAARVRLSAVLAGRGGRGAFTVCRPICIGRLGLRCLPLWHGWSVRAFEVVLGGARAGRPRVTRAVRDWGGWI